MASMNSPSRNCHMRLGIIIIIIIILIIIIIITTGQNLRLSTLAN